MMQDMHWFGLVGLLVGLYTRAQGPVISLVGGDRRKSEGLQENIDGSFNTQEKENTCSHHHSN